MNASIDISVDHGAGPPRPGDARGPVRPANRDTGTGSFSILFETEDDRRHISEQPAYFRDLNIDQIVDGVVTGRDEYDLRALFNAPLRRPEAIRYRNDVFRDCRKPIIGSALRNFAAQMRTIRAHLVQIEKLSEKYQRQAWLLDAIELYCVACVDLRAVLQAARPESRGFTTFLQYLDDYLASPRFSAMRSGVARVKNDLSMVRYKVLVEGGRFTVQRYKSEIDYSKNVLDTFARFRQGDVKDRHSGKFHDWPEMNHVEAKILEFVVLLFPEPFSRMDAFCNQHGDFRDPVIERFDREIQFYAGYLDYIRILSSPGFCDPEIAMADNDVHGDDGFDLALAVKLAKDGQQAVCNSFALTGKERILVVSGPNQGGKTTFARMFGQMHYLAAMGCPIPGTRARLRLFDSLFTHFEREESIETLSGKLQDDLNRIHNILVHATSDSIVILNEIFTSTSLADALFLSKRIIAKIIERDMLAVWVTFVDELSRLGPETVSMVSDVMVDDPAQRTFRIQRRPADGRSHAMSLAQKHGLTYERIIERVRP
jgi:hypothetical protein